MTTTDLLNEEMANPAALLADLRNRVLEGETVSAAEYSQVLNAIRRARTAAPAAKGSRAKAAPSSPLAVASLDDDF